MNRIPTFSKKYCSRRTLSRSSNFFTSFSRGIIHPRSRKFYLNSDQHTMTRPSTRTNPSIRMSCYHHCSFTSTITSSACWSNYNTTNRSKFKYFFLRPSRRWRPDSIPTPFLIFWSPRSIYSNYPRLWSNFTHCYTL